MEAELVALNSEGDIVSTHVLDISWKSVLLAMLPLQQRKQCLNWNENQLQKIIGTVPLNMKTAEKIAVAKVQESPTETKWSRVQKIEALKWLARTFQGDQSWENLCIDAKRKFKINPRDSYEEYAWFVACLGLKQLYDFMTKSSGCTCIIAPVEPLKEE